MKELLRCYRCGKKLPEKTIEVVVSCYIIYCLKCKECGCLHEVCRRQYTKENKNEKTSKKSSKKRTSNDGIGTQESNREEAKS